MAGSNVGYILHKLTKYEHFLEDNKSDEKAKVYNSKINKYKNQLQKLGISENNINNLEKLIGGDPKTPEEIKAITENAKQKIESLKKLDTSDIEKQIEDGKKIYKQIITTITGKLTELNQQVDALFNTLKEYEKLTAPSIDIKNKTGPNAEEYKTLLLNFNNDEQYLNDLISKIKDKVILETLINDSELSLLKEKLENQLKIANEGEYIEILQEENAQAPKAPKA